MIEFMYGALIGFVVGYPFGLWATWYNNKRVRENGDR